MTGNMNNSRGPSQLDLGFGLPLQPDRNSEKGGRSFYFFDLDDNVLHLQTPIFIYDLRTGAERAVSTGEFAKISSSLGKPGPYEFFGVNGDDRVGSFRKFRDHPALGSGARQPFVQDIQEALELPDFHWKGPSWECFEYAVHNERPVALITARGHDPATIREGLSQLAKAGFLSREPNYLEIYPVSHPVLGPELGGGGERKSTAELKKRAIIRCVEAAMEQYGNNPHHRFGMSDDDPDNITLITQAKRLLKARYPQNSFFVIHAGTRPVIKYEIFCDHMESSPLEAQTQLHFEF
ncbi:MAG TPA: hypothetical protein DIS93_03535 [Bdellovibrionales bacterium]|nr:hypothetical protein [Bdellovibrionales bacterium]